MFRFCVAAAFCVARPLDSVDLLVHITPASVSFFVAHPLYSVDLPITPASASLTNIQIRNAILLQGTSPMLVGVMASRVAGLTPSTKVGDISSEQWSALYSGPWRRWLEVIDDGGAKAVLSGGPEADGDGANGDGVSSSGEDNRVVSLSLLSSAPMVPWMAEDGTSYYPTTLGEDVDGDGNGAAALGGTEGGGDIRGGLTNLQQVMETYYRATQSNDEFDRLKRRCLARITATLSKLRDRAVEFEGQLAAAQEDKVRRRCWRGWKGVTCAFVRALCGRCWHMFVYLSLAMSVAMGATARVAAV